MAQPVFDGHPLEEYFKDSGEASEPMPGGAAEFSLEPYLTGHPTTSQHSERMEKLCFLIFGAIESLRSLFSSDRMSQRTQAFAERFKYGVISSSLLSPAFPTTPAEPHRRGLSPSLPGKLCNTHSRTPSAAESMMTDTLSLSMPPEPETPVWPITLSFTIVIAALSARFYFFALLLLVGTLYYMHVHRRDVHSKPDVMTPSLQALQQLMSAGQLWDGVINDTFAMLENEERSIFYGPTSPLAASSSLRLALSTSLLTTQTQCDNVRQLLSAITSPSELAQLAEMYAPPSPVKSTFASGNDSHRPLSHPGPSPHNTTPLTDRARKRSTWNGSYASLALAGTPPPFQIAQRREKRRSDLSALLGAASPTPAHRRSRNALSSPPQLLADVSEEEEMVTAESSLLGDEDEPSFGAAALDLYRNRANGGLRTLQLSQRSAPPSLARGQSGRRRTTMSPGSRYTRMHATRHSFSLSSLRQSLQNALASKRFACSHLLALRFEDDEDEVYWEDVRSVMSLLTSTLVDASSRLSEVLEHVEEEHLKVDNDDARSERDSRTPSSLASPPARCLGIGIEHDVPTGSSLSFAPTPGPLARFASHVNAISSALDDAREQLAQCVASLKEKDERPLHSPGHSSHPSSSSASASASGGGGSAGAGAGASAGAGATEHPAILAYERLRRELGLALRECERGRERLVYLVSPPTPPTEEEVLEAEEAEEERVHVEVVSPEGVGVSIDGDGDMEHGDENGDDATPHLLLAASPSHLPPPGIEQVFEAHAGSSTGVVRERSKLSREERIKRVRAKRVVVTRPDKVDRDDDDDDDVFLSPDAVRTDRERWGPSGDVVQELRDVIWKVGERRRKMCLEQERQPRVTSVEVVSQSDMAS